MRKPNPKAKKQGPAERRTVRVEPSTRARKENRHRGASVENFLREEDLYESASTPDAAEFKARCFKMAHLNSCAFPTTRGSAKTPMGA